MIARWLTALLLAGCTSGDALPAPRRAGEHQLRVMTYNVNFGVAGDPSGIAAIERAHPDLVLLQETNDVWEAALVGRLAAELPHHRFAPPHDAWLAGGMGILSRWPILSAEQLLTPAGPFFAWRIVVDAPGGPLQLLNLHLRPPMSDSGSWVVGYFTTRDDREREARAHLAKLDPTLPTLVVGDFNEEDDGKALAVFRARGFHSALPRFRPDADTWRWPISRFMTLRFRLDHLLHDARFRVVGADIVDAGRSDHTPVWADLVRAP